MRVDFYLLNEEISEGAHSQSAHQAIFNEHKTHFACRLIEKIYLRGHQIFVYCNTKEEAENLDEQLWIFKESSFIPHNLQNEDQDTPPPIQIGYAHESHGFSDILLNFSKTTPKFFPHF